jgi:hypothetical protein
MRNMAIPSQEKTMKGTLTKKLRCKPACKYRISGKHTLKFPHRAAFVPTKVQQKSRLFLSTVLKTSPKK